MTGRRLLRIILGLVAATSRSNSRIKSVCLRESNSGFMVSPSWQFWPSLVPVPMAMGIAAAYFGEAFPSLMEYFLWWVITSLDA